MFSGTKTAVPLTLVSGTHLGKVAGVYWQRPSSIKRLFSSSVVLCAYWQTSRSVSILHCLRLERASLPSLLPGSLSSWGASRINRYVSASSIRAPLLSPRHSRVSTSITAVAGLRNVTEPRHAPVPGCAIVPVIAILPVNGDPVEWG